MTIIKQTEGTNETNSVSIDKVVPFIKSEKESSVAEANTIEEAELNSIAYVLKNNNLFGRLEVPDLYPNLLIPLSFYEARFNDLDSIVLSVEASCCLLDNEENRKAAINKNNNLAALVREGVEGYYYCIMLTEFSLDSKEYFIRMYPYTIDMLDKVVIWHDDKVSNIVIDFDEYVGAIKTHDLVVENDTPLANDPFALGFLDSKKNIIDKANTFPFNQLNNIETEILDSLVKINETEDLSFYEDIRLALGVTFQCL